MKVILLEDVPRVGHEGDIIEVADGYVRNYLEPRKLAVKAGKGAIKDLEARRAGIARREDEKRIRAEQLAEGLQEQKIIVHAPTGEGTRLHGSVTAQQLAEAAGEQLKFDIDRRDIDIAEPIRELGDYLVTARVYKDVTAQLAVTVMPLVAEDEDEDATVYDEDGLIVDTPEVDENAAEEEEAAADVEDDDAEQDEADDTEEA